MRLTDEDYGEFIIFNNTNGISYTLHMNRNRQLPDT